MRLAEKHLHLLLSLAVFVGIALIAVLDSLVVRNISLDFVYLLPIALVAAVQGLRATLGVAFACLLLREWLGPFEHWGWALVVRTLIFAGIAGLLVVAIRLARQRRELIRTLTRHKQELEEELRLAAEVQQRLLPQRHVEGERFEIAGYMHPARQVTGDFYDILELPGGDVGLAIADVAGKGAPAALVMPIVQTALRISSRDSASPEQVVGHLSQVLYDVLERARYVGFFFGVLRRDRRLFEYTNGGHHPPLLLRRGCDEPEWLEQGGPVAGLLPGARWETARAELQPDDVLVLYTDGVTEAVNDGNEEYSAERLIEVVCSRRDRPAREMVEAIHRSVSEFCGGRPPEDDMTLIVVRVLDRI